jgi:hypothetical protein
MPLNAPLRLFEKIEMEIIPPYWRNFFPAPFLKQYSSYIARS